MDRIKRIALFSAGIVMILMLLDGPFRGGYWYTKGYLADRDCRIAGIQEEPEGQIEVLNVGDSLANIAITPLELYRDFGITSYVMGRDLQKCTETYYAIKLAIQKQPIKVVLWEVHNLCKHQKGYEPYMVGISEYAKYRSQFIKYHYVWKRVMEGKGIRKYFKGYVVNEKVVPYTKELPYLNLSNTEVYEIPRDQMYVFKKICALCQKEGIKLVLYAAPSPHCYSMKMLNGYAKLAKDNGLDYLDANLEVDRLKIDFAGDYCDDDADHLNLFGTRKMTRYLGEYLASECGLEDHRGDEAYRSWDELLTEYEAEVIRMKGIGYPDLEKENEKERFPRSGKRNRKKTSASAGGEELKSEVVGW